MVNTKTIVMNKLYSLFFVSEYKGGELHCSTNMTEEDLCEYLYEDLITDYLYDSEETEEHYEDDEILQIFDELYSSDWDNYYAYDTSGGYICFEHVDNKLVKVDMLSVISSETKIKVFNKLLNDYHAREKD